MKLENKAGAERPIPKLDTRLPAHVKPAPIHHKKSEGRLKYKPDQTPGWKIFLDVATIALAGFVAVVYNAQLDATREANALTRKQFLEQIRPWIRVNKEATIYQGNILLGFSKNGDEIDKPAAQVANSRHNVLPRFHTTIKTTFQNIGNSPAVNESQLSVPFLVKRPFVLGAGYGNMPIPEVPYCSEISPRMQTKSIIFQGTPYVLEWEGAFDPDQVKEWDEFKRVLVVSGCIKYDDSSSQSHQTNFCSLLDESRPPSKDWISCPRGNEAW